MYTLQSQVIRNIVNPVSLVKLPDGTYPKATIESANNIAIGDYLLTCQIVEDSSIGKDLVLNAIFDLVKASIGFKDDDFQGQLVDRMTENFAMFCIRHNVRFGVAGTDMKKELETAQGTGKRISIFVHECHLANFPISQKVSLLFLEFIYKYSPDGPFYQSAFHQLFKSISNESKRKMFKIFIDHYSPVRPILPLDFSSELTDLETLATFKPFLKSLYVSIQTRIDYANDPDLYFKQVMVVITNIISNRLFDEPFIDVLSLELTKMNLMKYNFGDRLISILVKNFSKIPKSETSFLELLSVIFMSESNIEKVKECDEVILGSLLFQFKHNAEDLYNSKMLVLSPEAQAKIDRMIRIFNFHEELLVRVESLKFVKTVFFDYSNEQLIKLVSDINEISAAFAMLQKLNVKTLISSVAEVGLVLKSLLNSEPYDENVELNLYRFQVFLALLSMSMNSTLVLNNSKFYFVKILKYYNENVRHFRPEQARDIEKMYSEVRVMAARMIDQNVFLSKTSEFKILFEFYCLTFGPRYAVAEISSVLKVLLCKGPNRTKIAKDIQEVCTEIEVDSAPILLSFLTNRIEFILRNSSDESLMNSFDSCLEESMIIKFIDLLLNSNQLNRTQLIVISQIQNHLITNQIS